jgi:hypothetical protein
MMARARPAAVLGFVLLVVVAGVVPAVATAPSPSPEGVGEESGATDSGIAGAPTDAAAASSQPLATMPPAPTNNSTARLVIPEIRVTQSEFETVRIGLGSALQSGSDGARYAHERLRIRREFEAASMVDEKRSVIDNALIELEERSHPLQARERRTIRQYSDGNITARELVQRLARLDAEAREIRKTLDLLRTLTDRINVDDFDSRIRIVSGRTEPLEGPVRHRAARVMAGDAGATRVHVTASHTGVVLSTMVGDQYLREGTEWRNRNASGSSDFDYGRFEELYPWITKDEPGDIFWRGENLYKFRANHAQGSLRAYVDASTSDVFQETQRLSVEEMPTTMTVVSASDDIRITLQRTYVGGPLGILVENPNTDAVLNARVVIDGYDLGNTGADGHVRTLEPRPRYTVNVTAGGTSYSVTIDRSFEASED